MSSYHSCPMDDDDICNYSLLTGEDLCLQDLAKNALLETKLTSIKLFTSIPKNLLCDDKCGKMIDLLHAGEVFKVSSFRDRYEERWKESHELIPSPTYELTLRRNLLRNLYSLTDCVLTKPDFLIQFKHLTSPPICKSNSTLSCCPKIGHYENSFELDTFFSYIKTYNKWGFETIRRFIDFPGIRTSEIFVRIRYCIIQESERRKKHYHFTVTFTKIKCAEKINLNERTSKSLGSILLLDDLKCAEHALCDLTLSKIF